MTTIVSLIKKDFQEVFPSIIGDEEHKLSIDEILGSSPDFIIKKIQNLKEAVNTERTELISFLNLLKIADEGLEYESNIHYKLKRFAERYPNHKSFKFFVYRYVLSTSYDNDEYPLEKLTLLYKGIIEDDTLMQITDFISESELGNSIITLNEVSEEIVSILRDAISNYPQKIILLWITAILYRVQGKYQEAIRYNKLFMEKLESFQNPDSKENLDLDFVDTYAEQMVCFQLADLNFDIKNYSNSLYYCNKVLILDQDKENSSFYFDTLIIRIRIHMNSNDTGAFQQDYDELLKVVTEEELKENYSDILNYAK